MQTDEAKQFFVFTTKRNVSAAIASYRGANARHEFNVQRPTQGVSNCCTPPRGALEIPPRGHARLDHPPLWRRPRGQTSAWTSVPAPPPSRQHPNKPPCAQGPAGSSAAGPHIPMVGNHRAIFSPQAPTDLGDERAATRLYSWDAAWATKTIQFGNNRQPPVRAMYGIPGFTGFSKFPQNQIYFFDFLGAPEVREWFRKLPGASTLHSGQIWARTEPYRYHSS